jgi:hypothetical protein
VNESSESSVSGEAENRHSQSIRLALGTGHLFSDDALAHPRCSEDRLQTFVWLSHWAFTAKDRVPMRRSTYGFIHDGRTS